MYRFPTDMKVDDEPHTISLRENVELKVTDFNDVMVVDPTGKKPVALYTPEEALAGKPSPDIARLAHQQISIKGVDAEVAGTKPAPIDAPSATPETPRPSRRP